MMSRLLSFLVLVLSSPVIAASNLQQLHESQSHTEARRAMSPDDSSEDTSDSECCFRIGYGAMMAPCCLKKVGCSEYRTYVAAQKKPNSEESRQLVGGNIGRVEGSWVRTREILGLRDKD